jgi:EAL domain-containing protein (putative c-di-GMP-specific phosphodiesterase class I)
MHIVYQPVVELAHGEIVGYEALSRFANHESPDLVFREAWERGNGVELEVQAFEMAVRNFPHRIDEAYLAINASAKTIIATRGKLMDDPGLEVPWPRLVVEISEKHEVVDYLQLDRPISLMRLHKARMAIDDIGAPGYSGFGAVLQVEPDILKIDRSLISHIEENPAKRAIVRGIVTTARCLRATVVAEGIETEEEMKWCTSLEVDCGQGYYFGKPASFPEQNSDSNQAS